MTDYPPGRKVYVLLNGITGCVVWEGVGSFVDANNNGYIRVLLRRLESRESPYSTTQYVRPKYVYETREGAEKAKFIMRLKGPTIA